MFVCMALFSYLGCNEEIGGEEEDEEEEEGEYNGCITSPDNVYITEPLLGLDKIC